MVLNGDILEYENIGVTEEEEVVIAALLMLGDVINFLYLNNLRLRGGGLNLGPAVMAVGKALGPTGRDWVFRHFFTDRYRNMIQADRDEYVRSRILSYQQESSRQRSRIIDVGRAAARLKYFNKGTAPKLIKDSYSSSNKMSIWEHPKFKVRMNTKEGKAAMGYHMLAQKNATQRMFKSTCFYEMHPVLNKLQYGTTGFYPHLLKPGNGPHLYAFYTTDLKAQTQVYGTDTRANSFSALATCDVGGFGSAPDANNQFIGMNMPVYIFSCDWPFAIMNPDPLTQVEPTNTLVQQGQVLRWAYYTWNTTSDMNIPRTLTFVVQNAAWTYLTHYKTTIDFQFYSTSSQNYMVEILIFKFKADVDTMNYKLQALAPMDRQVDNEIYCNESPRMYNHEDIYVLKRKRIMIPAKTNALPWGTSWRVTDNQGQRSEVLYRYVCDRQYVIKRPIVNSLNTSMTESEFFNTYYDRQKGIYARVCGWPVSPPLVIGTDGTGVVANEEQNRNTSYTAQACTIIGNGVGCFMNKTSKWKLDQNVGN